MNQLITILNNFNPLMPGGNKKVTHCSQKISQYSQENMLESLFNKVPGLGLRLC